MTISNEVAEQLKSFANAVFSQQKLHFDGSEKANFGLLINAGILKLHGDQIIIADYSAVVSEVTPLLSSHFGFLNQPNVSDLKKFRSDVEIYFDHMDFNYSYEFSNRFFQKSIYEFVKNGNGSLLELTKSYKREDKDIFLFETNLCEIWPNLDIPVAESIEICEWMVSQVKSTEPNIIDGNTYTLVNAFNKIISGNKQVAKEAFDICVMANPKRLREAHPIILSCNYNQNAAFLNELRSLYADHQYEAAVVIALGIIDFQTDTPIELFFQLVESKSDLSPAGILELPRFYCNVLSHSKNADLKIITHCFKKLAELAFNYPDQLFNIFNNLRFLQNYPEEISCLINELIPSITNIQKYARAIADTFIMFDDSKYFFAMIRTFTSVVKANFDPKPFTNAVIVILGKDRMNFDYEIIQLLIANEGIYRHAGRRLLQNILSTRNKHHFSFNILDLSAIDQYKLCISITDDFHEPENIIPFIAPLYSSPYDLVRFLMTERLQVMTEDYLNDVTDTLQTCLDLSKGDQLAYLEHLKQYVQDFNGKLNEKWLVRELDPRNTQYKYLTQLTTLNNRKMEESVGKSIKKDSLLSILGSSNLMLAKGGGVKIDDKDDIMKLSSIQTKLTLPRTYFIAPERYDWRHREIIFKDWTNEFTKWEAMISL